MTRVGFIGRTKSLYEAIKLFAELDGFEVSFIWTCKDESYYDFHSNNFKDLANDLGAKFFYSSRISEFERFVEADVVVSINFINVIPESFIGKFRFGVINAHAGDLPRYRGNACPNWAILNDENQTTEQELLYRIAMVRYSNVIESEKEATDKLVELKNLNSELFTVRLLSKIFGMSTGKISNLLNRDENEQ